MKISLPPVQRYVQIHGIRFIGDFKLIVSVNMSMYGCLALCVSPMTDWVYPVPHPMTVPNEFLNSIYLFLITDPLCFYLTKSLYTSVWIKKC